MRGARLGWLCVRPTLGNYAASHSSRSEQARFIRLMAQQEEFAMKASVERNASWIPSDVRQAALS